LKILITVDGCVWLVFLFELVFLLEAGWLGVLLHRFASDITQPYLVRLASFPNTIVLPA
jgi:hypothetical protein